MIIGLPPYQTPVEIGVRCICLRYYVVFTGTGRIVGDAIGRAKERARNMNAVFVDARSTPFLECSCGQALDFLPDETLTIN